MMDAFFVEWQVEGYDPVVEKRNTKEEAEELLKKRVSEGIEILGVWGANEWHLCPDKKIRNYTKDIPEFLIIPEEEVQ